MPSSADTESPFNLLRQLVEGISGNVIRSQDDFLIERRLKPLAEQLQIDSIESIVNQLPNSLELQQLVAEAMTVNETSFFRDEIPFRTLLETILPQLNAIRDVGMPITIWSAASASGQEPYSLAMTALEFNANLEPNRLPRKFEILASDIDAEMVTRTREGRYSDFELQRGISSEFKAKYFCPDGDTWLVQDSLRQLVKGTPINLTESLSLVPKCDVVFLRNALLYFSKESKVDILTRIHSRLKPDGYLILGGGEATLNLEIPYRTEKIDETFWLRPTS